MELFCRKDAPTKVNEKHKDHQIVNQTLKCPYLYTFFQVCLLDSKTGLNVSVFLKQFKGGSKEVIKWIQTFDIQVITVEQITALEKLLPDTNTVNFMLKLLCIF